MLEAAAQLPQDVLPPSLLQGGLATVRARLRTARATACPGAQADQPPDERQADVEAETPFLQPWEGRPQTAADVRYLAGLSRQLLSAEAVLTAGLAERRLAQ